MENYKFTTSPATKSKPKRSAPALHATLLAFGALLIGAAAGTAADTYDYKVLCPAPNGGKRIIEKWNFWECECTSYVADKLNERGVPFKWSYKNGSWGGASNWLNAAKKTGTPYSSYPRRGDVAWWGSGHVAYVDAVDSYANVTISEYNWGNPRDFHTRTVQRGAQSYPANFIHF